MNSGILVLFEDENIYPDAVNYAREFALRIDARVSFLMLVSISFARSEILGAKRHLIKELESRSGKLLARFSTPFIQNGIEISSALKIGDPAQELLKYLAERPPFQAIVWGSGSKAPFGGKGGKQVGHWLPSIAGSLECPLLTITKKQKDDRS